MILFICCIFFIYSCLVSFPGCDLFSFFCQSVVFGDFRALLCFFENNIIKEMLIGELAVTDVGKLWLKLAVKVVHIWPDVGSTRLLVVLGAVLGVADLC